MIHLLREQYMEETGSKVSLAEYFLANKAIAGKSVSVKSGETVAAKVCRIFPSKVFPVSHGKNANTSITSTSVALWIGEINPKSKSKRLPDGTGVYLPVSFKKKEGEPLIDGLLETIELKQYTSIYVSTLKIAKGISEGDVVYIRGLTCVASVKDGKYGYFLNARMIDSTNINNIVFCRRLKTNPPPLELPERKMLTDFDPDLPNQDKVFFIDLVHGSTKENGIEIIKEPALEVSALAREVDNVFQRQLLGYIMIANEKKKEKVQLSFYIGKELLDGFHIQDIESWKYIISQIYGQLAFGLVLKTNLEESLQFTINETSVPDKDGDSKSYYQFSIN